MCPDYKQFSIGYGTLTLSSGQENYFGSTYTPSCNGASTQTGSTGFTNNVIKCGDKGKWQAGNYNCAGKYAATLLCSHEPYCL